MNEQLAVIGKKLVKRLDLVGIGVFVALLVASGYVFYMEENYQPEEVDTPPQPEWTRSLPSPELDTTVAQFVGRPTDIQQDIEIRRLVENNMFDLKSVKSQQEREQQIRQDFVQAQTLFNEKNYDEALVLVERVLSQNASHTKALELKQKIQEAKASVPAEATPAETGTPVPEATP